jgi:hypothetical protein
MRLDHIAGHLLIREGAFGEVWLVQYRRDTMEHIVNHSTPEDAIHAVCRLIDDGFDVIGIGIGPLTDSIEKEQIDRIFKLWQEQNTHLI